MTTDNQTAKTLPAPNDIGQTVRLFQPALALLAQVGWDAAPKALATALATRMHDQASKEGKS